MVRFKKQRSKQLQQQKKSPANDVTKLAKQLENYKNLVHLMNLKRSLLPKEST